MRGVSVTPFVAIASCLLVASVTVPEPAGAMPAFARQYGVSCNVCHAAYPRLNDFGNRFAGEMNYRMANWRDHTVATGDEMLALPKKFPLAARGQAFAADASGDAPDLQEADNQFLHPWDDMKRVGRNRRTVVTRGEGVYVYDSDGNRLLDLRPVRPGAQQIEEIDPVDRLVATGAGLA